MHESNRSQLTDDLADPLFIRDAGRISLTVTEVARMLTPPGNDTRPAHSRITGLAQRHLIHPHLNTSGFGPKFKLGCTEAVVAATMIELYDVGLSDLEIARSASMAMYNGDPDRDTPSNPLARCTNAVAALVGATRGEWWCLMVRAYKSDQTGERRIVSILCNSDFTPPPEHNMPPEFLPRATITVLLAPVLQPIINSKLLEPVFGRSNSRNLN